MVGQPVPLRHFVVTLMNPAIDPVRHELQAEIYLDNTQYGDPFYVRPTAFHAITADGTRLTPDLLCGITSPIRKEVAHGPVCWKLTPATEGTHYWVQFDPSRYTGPPVWWYVP